MWPFSHKTTLSDAGIPLGMTDWHSHILPGVDDGVETMEDSLEILEAYRQLGFEEVWLTPHIMEDVPNTPEKLKKRFSELQEAYNGPIKLHLAAENMLDPLFEQRLESEEVLPIGERGDHLLVETSYLHSPIHFHHLLKKVMKKGYFPLLAHPERYRYMTVEDYRNLHEEGVKFQTNIFSLIGIYGPEARKKSQWLLSNGLIDVAGSDIHRPSMLRFFSEKFNAGKAVEALSTISKNRLK